MTEGKDLIRYMFSKSCRKMVSVMSTLQNQITQSLEGLSDDSLRFILDMIQRFVQPSESRSVSINYGVVTQGKKRRLGSMKGQKFIADGHDIDECNDEIARLFEVDG